VILSAKNLSKLSGIEGVATISSLLATPELALIAVLEALA